MSRKTDWQTPFELDPATAALEIEPPAGLPVEAEAAGVPAPPPRRARFGPWLIGGASILLLGALGVEAWDFVTNLWQRNVVFGAAFAAVGVATGAAALGLLVRELMDLRRLARVESLREAAARLLASEVHGEVATIIPPLEKLYRDRPALQPMLRDFERQDSESLSDGERIRLFARTVLRPIDKTAYRLVLAGARDVGLLTAMSPLGLLDGFIVLGRNLMLLRQIGRLYGVRPGLAGTIALLRKTLRNVAIAGVGELITEHAAHGVGAGLLTMLSARAGQGVTNAVLAARLGLVAMTQSRPVPFAPEELPKLSKVRAELLESLGADRTA